MECERLESVVGWIASRIVALGWACSSWTKATVLLDQHHQLPFEPLIAQPLFASTSKDRIHSGFYHLLVSYLVLNRITAMKPLSIQIDQDLTLQATNKWLLLVFKLVGCVAGWTCLVTSLDEFVVLWITLFTSGPKLVALEGIDASATQNSDKPVTADPECMICLGSDDGGSNLYSYCCISSHVSHSECMRRWLMTCSSLTPHQPQTQPSCPLCRRPLQHLHMVTSWEIVRKNGVSGFLVAIKTLIRKTDVLKRIGFTFGCVSLLCFLFVIRLRLGWLSIVSKLKSVK